MLGQNPGRGEEVADGLQPPGDEAGLLLQLPAGAVDRVFVALHRPGGQLDKGLADDVAPVADQDDPSVGEEGKDDDGARVNAHFASESLARFVVLQVVHFEPDFFPVVDDLLVDQAVGHGAGLYRRRGILPRRTTGGVYSLSTTQSVVAIAESVGKVRSLHLKL